MSTTVNFSEFADYTPYTGDGAAVLLPFDGYFKTKLKKFEATESKAGNPMVKMTLTLDEADLPPHVLYGQALIGGKNANGFNSKQFADVLLSSGLYTLESLRAAAAAGEAKDAVELLQTVQNQDLSIYVDVQAESYKGKVTSKVQNFILKSRYEEEVNAGTNTRPHSVQASSGSSNGSSKASKAAAGNVLADVI